MSPSKGTPLRNVRVPDELWAEAGRVARELGYDSLSAYVVDALRLLVEDNAIPWDLRET